jgi:hypothetical protein
MSSGSFVTVPYLTSESTPRVLPLRCQPESIAPTGGGAVGPITGTQLVKAPGSSRKSYGIHCRHIVIARKIGTAAGPYTGASVFAKLPVGSPGQMAGFPVGFVLTYAGQADWQVVSQVPEKIR